MQAVEDGVSHGLSVIIMEIANQLQSIDASIFPGVLDDGPVLRPRGDNAKREQRLRNSEDG